MDTTVRRSQYGDLFAETVVPLGADRRELRIDTRKGFRGLRTSATVVQVSEDGRSFTHAMGLGTGLGDFSRTLRQQDPKVRATEKAIRSLHADALTEIDATLAAARAHYAAKVPA